MTASELILWHLRIYGPCSVQNLCKTTQLKRGTITGTLYRLRKDGLALRLGLATYDITGKGLGTLPKRAAPLEMEFQS